MLLRETRVLLLRSKKWTKATVCWPSQQVTPAVGFACAQRKTHAGACQPILVGGYGFFDEVEKTIPPTPKGV
jgi:hypothetical protein